MENPISTVTGPAPAQKMLKSLRAFGLAAFVALAYLPILLTRPGRVTADTKTYLYLNPGRLLQEAASMWEPNIGLGTVTHQTIGYLFPMGPFYWLLETGLRLPSWVAQRLWLGTLILLAGLGVRYLMRTLDIRGPGLPVAMLLYSLTPYVLEFSPRLSALLGPWAALPWMLALIIRAMRVGGWRYPALFALTVQCVGGVNLTALLFAGIGPLLWIPYSIWIARETTWRRAWQVLWRTGLLVFVTSLWWLIGLTIQSKFGLNILRFTESIETVSATSYPYEIFRGLGYWFFYGRDKIGLWNPASIVFTQHPANILISYALPTIALLSAACIRWRHRTYFIFSALIAMVVAVGASPYNEPSLVGGVFKSFATGSTLGFAMRSTSRVFPVMALSFAILTGVGITALVKSLRRDLRWVGIAAAFIIGALAIANAPGVWNANYYSAYLERDEKIPAYWRHALKDLDKATNGTRVLSLPGSDFAGYRWGMTVDPIEPGLMQRPFVARELVPWGSDASTNLLIALDQRIQKNVLDQEALAPISRLLGVGDILLRLDLQTDRFSLVPADELWDNFSGKPASGLSKPKSYGKIIPGTLVYPPIADPTRDKELTPPPVATVKIKKPTPIIKAKDSNTPMLVAGDGEGLVDLASAGLLETKRAIIYSGTFAGDSAALRDAAGASGVLVVTDSNQRRGQRWSSLRDNFGYTEQAGELPLRTDLFDQRLNQFPGSNDSSRTVSVLTGIDQVRATAYGSRFFGYSTASQPFMAIDGDLRSSWEVGGGMRTIDHDVLQIDLNAPLTTDHIDVVQPFDGRRGRWITSVGIRFDHGKWIERPLGIDSRSPQGGSLRFAPTEFKTVELRIGKTTSRTAEKVHSSQSKSRLSGVGFAEVGIAPDILSPQIKAKKFLRLPTDLLDGLGPESDSHALLIQMTGEESQTQDRVIEPMNRIVSLPTAREFSFAAFAKLRGPGRDGLIDRYLGIPQVEEGGVTAVSQSSYNNPVARASSAIDGDPTTAWRTPVDMVVGRRIKVLTPAPITFNHLDLQIVNDGRHSLPTSIVIKTPTGGRREIDLPNLEIADAKAVEPNSTVTIPLDFDPLTGDEITVTIRSITAVNVLNPDSRELVASPVGIAELGIPGVLHAPTPIDITGACHSDLVKIDGVPFPIRFRGKTASAIAQSKFAVEACSEKQVLELSAGTHQIEVTSWKETGIDIGSITLASDELGAARDAHEIVATKASSIKLGVISESRTSNQLSISGATQPSWLILGQSINAGWHASLNGKDLGDATLIDGFANGWRIPAVDDGSKISITWTPQRSVSMALLLTVIALLICLGIVIVSLLRSRRKRIGAASNPPKASQEELDEAPYLLAPWSSERRVNPSSRAAILTGLACGIVGAAIVSPLTGILLGLITGYAVISTRARTALRLMPVVILALIGVYVALGQLRHNYAPVFEWSSFFSRARVPAWFAILAISAEVVVSIVRERTPSNE